MINCTHTCSRAYLKVLWQHCAASWAGHKCKRIGEKNGSAVRDCSLLLRPRRVRRGRGKVKALPTFEETAAWSRRAQGTGRERMTRKPNGGMGGRAAASARGTRWRRTFLLSRPHATGVEHHASVAVHGPRANRMNGTHPTAPRDTHGASPSGRRRIGMNASIGDHRIKLVGRYIHVHPHSSSIFLVVLFKGRPSQCNGGWLS